MEAAHGRLEEFCLWAIFYSNGVFSDYVAIEMNKSEQSIL